MKKLPKLLEVLLGDDAKIALEILVRCKDGGLPTDGKTRQDFCESMKTTEYYYYKIRSILEECEIISLQGDKYFLNELHDIEYARASL